jgi:HPt (histidine-containing phosphotransfer) domain-containing protein
MDDMPTNQVSPGSETTVGKEAASSSPVDRSVLDEYIEVIGPTGKKSLLGLIDVYLRTSHGILAKMNEAIEKEDLKMLREAGHSFKSSSGSLGASRLFELCRELEREVKTALEAGGPVGTIEGYRQEVVEIHAEFTRVCLALSKIREEIAG